MSLLPPSNGNDLGNQTVEVPLAVMAAILRSVGGSFAFNHYELANTLTSRVVMYNQMDPFRLIIKLEES